MIYPEKIQRLHHENNPWMTDLDILALRRKIVLAWPGPLYILVQTLINSLSAPR